MKLTSKQKRRLAQKISWKKRKALQAPELTVTYTVFLKRKAGRKETVRVVKVELREG
jgi:hypothetical protein